jgi:hypothetical protein
MGVTVTHALSATTPDDPAYEIRPSHWNSNHAITFAQDWQATGNTTQSTSGSGDGMFISGAGIASVGVSNNSLIVSVPAGAPSPVNFSAGTTSNNLGSVVFGDSNGISFGLNGSTITGTVSTRHTLSFTGGQTTYNTSGTQPIAAFRLGGEGNVFLGITGADLIVNVPASGTVSFAGGNTTYNTTGSIASYRSLTFVGEGNAFLGHTGGQIAVNVPVDGTVSLTGINTTYNSSGTYSYRSLKFTGEGNAFLGHTNGLIAVNVPSAANVTMNGNTTHSSTGTYAYRDLRMSGAGIASLGISNGTIIVSVPSGGGAGDGVNALVVNAGASTASTTLTLSDSNNVSFGLAAGVITATASFAAQTNQTGGIYVTAQSTGQSSSSTYDLRTLSIVPDGIVSAGWSNGSFRISATQSNQAFSAAGGSSAFQTLGFSDNAYASWTNTNGSVALTELRGSFYATSNTTQSSSGTINLDSIIFQGAGVASVGVSNGSVVISVPAAAGAATRSMYEPQQLWSAIMTDMRNGTIHIMPLFGLEGALSVSRFNMFGQLSISSSSNSSHAGVISAYMGIYTRNNSTLSLASSGSQSYQWTNTSNNSTSVLAGSVRAISVPITINASNGDYWAAIMVRTSTTNANWFTYFHLMPHRHESAYQGVIGEAANNTRQMAPGWGQFSASSTALPASMAFSEISGSSGTILHRFPYCNFVNFTA